jgi:putative membrane protein
MDITYCGPAPLPGELVSSWNLDPLLLAALIALGFVVRRQWTGLAAVAVLTIALVSPLCALSSALFSARVAHHVLLVAVAAPLLAVSSPARRGGGIALPFALSTVVLWAWHVPAAYDAALGNVAIYWVMQLTLLGSAILFWRAVLAETRSPMDRLVFVVAAFAQMGLLGAILTFASQPLYSAHAMTTLAWGLMPLEDQRLGGLLMWVPAGIPYAVAAALIARRDWTRLTGAVA